MNLQNLVSIGNYRIAQNIMSSCERPGGIDWNIIFLYLSSWELSCKEIVNCFIFHHWSLLDHINKRRILKIYDWCLKFSFEKGSKMWTFLIFSSSFWFIHNFGYSFFTVQRELPQEMDIIMLIVQLLFQIGPGEVPKAYSSLSGNEKEVLSLSLYMYVSSEGGNFTPPTSF